MRFVWAVVAFIVATGLIGAGIAQRTIFLGPTTQEQHLEVDDQQAYTLIDGDVLNHFAGSQKLIIDSEAATSIYGAYGRTSDVTAWLADKSYNHITVKDSEVVSAVTPAATAVPEVTEDAQKQLDAAVEAGLVVPNATTPSGSDLWLEEFTDDSRIVRSFQLPDDMSVLIASDGLAPAPANITLQWPVDNSTPWTGPLIVLGVIALLTGIVLYLLGIRHMRRSRGPRRRALPPLEATQPIDIDTEEAKGVISSSQRKQIRPGTKKAFIALPMLLVGTLAFSGCSPSMWPSFSSPTPTVTPTETVVAPENQLPPAVTQQQAERIITEVAETVAKADEAGSAAIAATRLTGPALAERTTNYTLRAALKDEAALDPIAQKPYQIILPQQTESWPRVLLAVWQDQADSTNPPRIMTFEQADAWSPYKLAYIGRMEASAAVPGVAPTQIGAPRVVADSTFLSVKPQDLSEAYASLIDTGADSEHAALFDLENDTLLAKIAEGRADRLAKFNETGAETGKLTFSSAATTYTPIGLATLESGAIVSVAVTEVDTVKPTNSDAVIRLTNNPQVKALTGVEESAKGFTTTYIDQLFFYVPAQGSNDRVKLIAFTSNLLSAKEIK